MRKTLIDAGPIIALFDKNDTYHQRAVSFLKEYRGRLITSCAVVTEVMFMLNFSHLAQTAFLSWVALNAIEVKSFEKNHIPRIIELTEKYADLPMDFADATLVVISEEQGIKEIMSIDSDFNIYRTISNDYLQNIFILHD